eukprot:336128_1
MPAKKHQQPESDSDDGMDMMGGGAMDFSRFTNPNYSREFLATLPGKVRDRTKVLLAMDDKATAKRDALRKEKDMLRRSFEEKFAVLFARRKEIVNGEGKAVSEEEVAKGYPTEHKDVVSITAG